MEAGRKNVGDQRQAGQLQQAGPMQGSMPQKQRQDHPSVTQRQTQQQHQRQQHQQQQPAVAAGTDEWDGGRLVPHPIRTSTPKPGSRVVSDAELSTPQTGSNLVTDITWSGFDVALLDTTLVSGGGAAGGGTGDCDQNDSSLQDGQRIPSSDDKEANSMSDGEMAALPDSKTGEGGGLAPRKP